MDDDHARNLGEQLLLKRTELELTTRQVAELAGLEQPTYVRIEKGQFKKPGIDKLAAIAEALQLKTADLYALADYTAPADLPSFTPYLRTKYRDLPAADVERIQTYAARLAKRHGIDISGPVLGEDES